jgi:hypothetical protein
MCIRWENHTLSALGFHGFSVLDFQDILSAISPETITSDLSYTVLQSAGNDGEIVQSLGS